MPQASLRRWSRHVTLPGCGGEQRGELQAPRRLSKHAMQATPSNDFFIAVSELPRAVWPTHVATCSAE